MLWVDATQIRYMSDLGFMPRSSEWFLEDASGARVNGYFIPDTELDDVKLALQEAGIYFHD